MKRTDEERLEDILATAKEILDRVAEENQELLFQNELKSWGLVKLLEIIGEAAFRLDPATREQYPQVPWREIIDMRHRLVHVYFDINLDIVRETIHHDLPLLIKALSGENG